MFNVWYFQYGKWILGTRCNRMIEALNYIWRVRENYPSLSVKVLS